MTPELETLDQLLGGDLPLSVVAICTQIPKLSEEACSGCFPVAMSAL
jgi:hypothetical protein